MKDGIVVFDSSSVSGSLYIEGEKSGSFGLNKIKITLSPDMKKITIKSKLSDGFTNVGNMTAQLRFSDALGFGGIYYNSSDVSKNVLSAQIGKRVYDTGKTSYGHIEIN